MRLVLSGSTCSTCVLALVQTTLSLASPSDPAALRKALTLPRVSLQMNLAFSTSDLTAGPRKSKPSVRELEARVRKNQSDGAAHLELATAYSDANRMPRAKQERNTALRLFRVQAAKHPNDLRIMAALGDALVQNDQAEAGLQLLRKATDRDAKSRQAWSWRAKAAQTRSYEALLGRRAVGWSAKSDNYGALMAKAGMKPSPERIAAWEALHREAAASLDMAVKCAPNDPEVYSERAFYRMMYAYMSVFPKADGEEPDTTRAAPGIAAMAEDFWHAARLTPNSRVAWTLPVMAELMAAAMASPEVGKADAPPDAAWKAMSEEARARCRKAIAAMTRLTQAKDRKEAAKAAESLGTLHILTGDQKSAEAALRRSIALAPEAPGAWEPLLGMLGQGERWKETVAVAEQFAQHHDSPKSRLILAKSLDKSGDRAGADAQVRAAQKRYPNDPNVALAGIVVDLRKPQSPAGLADVGTRLALLEPRIGSSASDDAKDNLNYTRAALLGFKGKDDEAKAILEKLVEKNPNDAPLKAVLEAVGG